MENVEERVKRIVANCLAIEESSVKKEAVLASDLGTDSLDIVEMVFLFEDEFNMSLDDDNIRGIRTVGDIVELIKNAPL